MPPFTALLHTKNDALRLGRALETLLPCAEILIVDHNSTDSTRRIAREYGARIIETDKVAADRHDNTRRYLDLARYDWILCLEPTESITEGLQASLFEWSALPSHRVVSGAAGGPAFCVFLREQTGQRWAGLSPAANPSHPRNWPLWHERLPAHEPSSVPLEGNTASCFTLTGCLHCPLGQ